MSLGRKESGSRLCRKTLPEKGWIITFPPSNSPDPLLPSFPSSHSLLVRVKQPRCGSGARHGPSALSMLPGRRPGKKGKTGLCCLKARAEVERARPAVGYGGRRMLLMEGRVWCWDFWRVRSISSSRGENEASFLSLSWLFQQRHCTISQAAAARKM